MYVIEQGIKNNEPVVFLHGLGATADSWAYQLSALSHYSVRVIAPDLPGFGRSKIEAQKWSFDLVCQDLLDLIMGRELIKVKLVGISMGGAIALKFALDFPEHVSGLLLANTFASLFPLRFGEFLYFTRRGIRALVLTPAGQAKLVASRVFPREDQRIYRNLLIRSINDTDPTVYKQAMRALVSFDVRKRLPNLKLPVWVISGLDDTTIPLHAQKRLVEHLPAGTRHFLIKNAGHAVNIDQPVEFNRILFEFLGLEVA